jgi:signal transduction histidine kinase
MIASEAITNAARHGAAELVRVQLIDDPPRLRIGDAGRGFDPAGARPRDGHGFGLVAMRERAEAVGARLRVDSRPGGGTTVEVAL